MSLLISLPESMGPQALCSALLDLEPGLEIMTGHKNVQNPDEVEFAVVWNHPEGLLLNYPNLKAISSYGHGADGLLADSKLPEGSQRLRYGQGRQTTDAQNKIRPRTRKQSLQVPPPEPQSST